MSEEDLINAIEYLVKKYAPNRDDLIETIKNNPRSAKKGGGINEKNRFVFSIFLITMLYLFFFIRNYTCCRFWYVYCDYLLST